MLLTILDRMGIDFISGAINYVQQNIDEVVDLDYATEGVEAAFDLDDNDLSETIERRAIGRSAKFSGGGGALLSGTTTGFGAANA